MSDAVVITLILAVALILVAVAAIAAWLYVQRRAQPAKDFALVTHGGYEQRGGYPSAPTPPSELPKVDGGPGPGSRAADAIVHDEEPKTDVPIPVHPSKTPHWVIYQPRPGRPAMHCHCHEESLYPGQPVLWWTRPDESVLLFCARTVTPPEEMSGQ